MVANHNLVGGQAPFTDRWRAGLPSLLAFVRTRVAPDAVEDLIAEVGLRAVRHKARFESAENPEAWLKHVAQRLIIDHYRRRATEQRKLAAFATEASDSIVDDACPTGPLKEFELADCIVPLIERLPAPYGEALLLTDIGGTSQRAAAERLGLSNSGMKSRVQRGRAKLRQALSECCGDPPSASDAAAMCRMSTDHNREPVARR